MPSLKVHVWLVGLVLLYTVFPILIALLGVGLASLLNCSHGGQEYQCAFPGLADVLNLMASAHWLGWFTLPTGGLLSLLGRLVERWLRSSGWL